MAVDVRLAIRWEAHRQYFVSKLTATLTPQTGLEPLKANQRSQYQTRQHKWKHETTAFKAGQLRRTSNRQRARRQLPHLSTFSASL